MKRSINSMFKRSGKAYIITTLLFLNLILVLFLFKSNRNFDKLLFLNSSYHIKVTDLLESANSFNQSIESAILVNTTKIDPTTKVISSKGRTIALREIISESLVVIMINNAECLTCVNNYFKFISNKIKMNEFLFLIPDSFINVFNPDEISHDFSIFFYSPNVFGFGIPQNMESIIFSLNNELQYSNAIIFKDTNFNLLSFYLDNGDN